MCSHTLTLFWLRKTSVTVKMFRLSFHVPFVWRSLQFLVRVSSFLSLCVTYIYIEWQHNANLSVAVMSKNSVQLENAGQSGVPGDHISLICGQVDHLEHLDRQGNEVSSLEQSFCLTRNGTGWLCTRHHNQERHFRTQVHDLCVIQPAAQQSNSNDNIKAKPGKIKW